MANTYFVCPRHGPPVEIDIAQDRPVREVEIAYFIRGFRILEATHEFDGYIVCFAWSSRTRLPHFGNHVIALIYGDEHCRIPGYVGRVGAVMKCHGLYPPFVPRARPLRLAQIELVEFLRNLALWMPTGWRWAFSQEVRARCHLLPMGYGIPSDVPIVEFAQRRYLSSFLGSIAKVPKRHVLRFLIGTPKAYSRTRLVEVLRRIEDRYGPDRIRVSCTSDFQESLSQGQSYAEVMAETQFCVAPRGTTHETWRVFDGLKAGCVVIADHLPRYPYYRGSPILQIEDWRDLPDMLDALMRDPAKLQALHRESLRFWQDELSEERLAQRYAAALGLETKRQLFVLEAGGDADGRLAPPTRTVRA